MSAVPSERPIRFDGRVVIVTGAGRGIGRAVALYLAELGARIVVHNRRADPPDEDPAGTLALQIRAAGGEAIAEHSDVRDPGSAAALVDCALSTWGRLDAVVLNAGVIASCPVAELEEHELTRIYETNTLAAYRLTRAALPALRRQGDARIVYTLSTAGLYGGPGLAAYAMAKGALIGLMRAVAAEESAHGLLANAICPTAVTRMTESFIDDPSLHAALAPEHVAPAIAWLASPACQVSGQIVLASGGLFRSAHVLQSAGVDLRGRVGVDDVARHATAILAPQELERPADAGAHFAAVIEELRRPPGESKRKGVA